MHRLSGLDFERARAMLEHLIERHPKFGGPKAWLGRWHNLAVAQGKCDLKTGIRRSMELVHQALDVEPGNAFALSVKALVHGYIEKRFDLARETYAEALASNPNEPLAWIGRSTLHAWEGDAAAAVDAAERALALSPLDPIRYYFESLAAVPMLAARDYARAIALATRSLRLNRMLSSTYKTLAEAQYLSGDRAAARITVQGLMAVEPDFTVERFKASSPLYLSPIGRECAEALLGSGVPAQ
jgi:tetratricopeptide (TPR) repeat protein